MITTEINTASFNAYGRTRIHAEVIENGSDYEVEVRPAKTNDSPETLYHINNLGIMAEGYNVHIYAQIEIGEIIVRMW